MADSSPFIFISSGHELKSPSPNRFFISKMVGHVCPTKPQWKSPNHRRQQRLQVRASIWQQRLDPPMGSRIKQHHTGQHPLHPRQQTRSISKSPHPIMGGTTRVRTHQIHQGNNRPGLHRGMAGQQFVRKPSPAIIKSGLLPSNQQRHRLHHHHRKMHPHLHQQILQQHGTTTSGRLSPKPIRTTCDPATQSFGLIKKQSGCHKIQPHIGMVDGNL
ncbi:hypothetical protein ACLOJK_006581 [Asimina triloba]